MYNCSVVTIEFWGEMWLICPEVCFIIGPLEMCKYRKISNIRCTKSQNCNVSHLVLQLSLPIPLKPGIKSKIKM